MFKFRKSRVRILPAAAALLLAVLLADIWASYHILQVTAYSLQSDRITHSMRIVLITDLHNVSSFGEGNRKLADQIREQEPDLILFAGDLINKDSPNLSVACTLLSQLTEIAPTYVSYGNQEIHYNAFREHTYHDRLVSKPLTTAMEEIRQRIRMHTGESGDLTYGSVPADAIAPDYSAAGAVVLENAWQDLEIKGNRLRIGGNYCYCFGLGNSTALSAMDPDRYAYLTSFTETEDRYRILMVHRPDSLIFAKGEPWQMELAVSGHNHGGQVILPFLGGLYGGDQGWFPQYDFGRFSLQGVRDFIITRGLSSAEQLLPRFNNLPEIVVIDLEPQG